MILSLITLYISFIFINRYIDYLLCKKSAGEPSVILWFTGPVYLCLVIIGYIVIIITDNKRIEWFLGKRWKK